MLAERAAERLYISAQKKATRAPEERHELRRQRRGQRRPAAMKKRQGPYYLTLRESTRRIRIRFPNGRIARSN
ncbi:hypothetical protein PSTT_16081 [Puccinia striiformis]|uniref:Uncharacterized protein n=1 Tax=Puccinia striiformis TaxID=27350 RepID=A0A2S4UEJ6_9BASI|nr:hypothetical protein PSTT_16081 [Puccinia striiformis]